MTGYCSESGVGGWGNKSGHWDVHHQQIALSKNVSDVYVSRWDVTNQALPIG
jgi:hypothetical protein